MTVLRWCSVCQQATRTQAKGRHLMQRGSMHDLHVAGSILAGIQAQAVHDRQLAQVWARGVEWQPVQALHGATALSGCTWSSWCLNVVVLLLLLDVLTKVRLAMWIAGTAVRC